MALQRLTISGYGQLELNQVAFRRDGRIEAQCFIGKEADGTTDIGFLENGMLLAVDKLNKRINKTSSNAGLIALHYSTEHMYDERKTALKDFKLVRGTFLPRMGYLDAGDRFTTNCIAYDDTEFAAVTTPTAKTAEQVFIEALGAIKTTPLYGVPCANGAIKVTATPGSGSVNLQVIEKTTMPDGQLGVKFIVLE